MLRKQKNLFYKFIILFIYGYEIVFCLIIDDTLSSNSTTDALNSTSSKINTNINLFETKIHNNSDSNLTNINHICFREEIYVEQVRIPIKQPVRVRSSNWCLEFPPRCSTYKTEIREVIKVQNVTKTKIIEFCCDGYAEIKSGNETLCKPICRGGCGKGFCNAPNECICDIGYTGYHCNESCNSGKWGDRCEKSCECQNNATCDNITGSCKCQNGWTGNLCEQQCSAGFYGFMCKNQCKCDSNLCNPKSGECISEEFITKLKPVELSTTSENPLNSTKSIIETLNSTIANLTENIDKLTKNLDKTHTTESVTLIVPETIVEITTLPPIIAQQPITGKPVILIKTSENGKQAVIIQHPTIAETTNNIAENLPAAVVPAVASKTPEIIHVITNLHQPLSDTNKSEIPKDHGNTESTSIIPSHDWSAVLSIISIFIVLIVLAAFGFVILYRKYLRNQEEANSPGPTLTILPNQTVIESKFLSKPLPDLPGFTQNFIKQRDSIISVHHPYTYTAANGAIYSITSKTYNRKESLDHLYDEIKYHSASSRL